MTKTFTENDLLRLIYDDVSEEEKLDISDSLLSDLTLLEKHEEMKDVVSALDSFALKAPNDAVSRILYYSKNA